MTPAKQFIDFIFALKNDLNHYSKLYWQLATSRWRIFSELKSLEKGLGNPVVLIELTSRCNFACGYCSSSFKERPKLDMDFGLFQHIVKQLPAITDKAVRLHVDGEPTLHPHFHEMVRMLNEHELRAILATNGSRLDPTFLDLDMDMLVSMSSSADEFKQRHKTMDYDQYVELIIFYLRSWLKTSSRQNIKLQISVPCGQDKNMLLIQEKEKFVDRIIECIGLPARIVPLRESEYNFKKSSNESLNIHLLNITGHGLYPVNGKRVEFLRTPSTGFCDSPWKTLSVLADGRVSCCCVDLSGGTSFTQPGEIWDKSLAEIWKTHSGIQSIRKSFLRRRIPLNVCQRCLAAYETRELRH